VPTKLPALALATGRCGIGTVLMITPALLARRMGVDPVTAERTAWLARMFAVRDLALGLGVLWTVRRSPSTPKGEGSGAQLKSLLLLGALCDAGDALAMASALRAGSVHALPAGATLASAAAAAVTGIVEAIR
jgi:hypothetical protein